MSNYLSIMTANINNSTLAKSSIGLKLSGKGFDDYSNYYYDNNGIGFQLTSNTSIYKEFAIINTSNYSNKSLQIGISLPCIYMNTNNKPLIINSNFIINNSNVGIGITNTQYALNIKGNIILSGTINNIFTQWNNINSNIYYNNGNIGIGITTPQSLLHLSSLNSLINIADTMIIGKNSNLDALLWNYNNSNLSFGTSNTEKLKINNNGKIGIGTNIFNSLANINGNVILYGFMYISNLNNIKIWNNYNNNINFRGNIGIGISIPQSILHISSSNAFIKIKNNIIIGKDSNQNGIIWNYSNNDLIFSSSNNIRLRLTNDGNVGINTTDLSKKLNINNINIYGNLIVNNVKFYNPYIINSNIFYITNNNELNIINYNINNYSLPITTCNISNILSTNYSYLLITDTINININNPIYADLLLVGSGGNGGMIPYSGGGGAGEVIYYSNYFFNTGIYNFKPGISQLSTLSSQQIIKAIQGDDTAILDLNNYILFNKKKPWACYFAENFNGSNLYDSSGNNRHATSFGTINKITSNGNGIEASNTFISGTTTSGLIFPIGSIPTYFTILSLTRYTGSTRQRILQSQSNNWVHGHWNNLTGICYYGQWSTPIVASKNITTDWLCCIGNNANACSIYVDGDNITTLYGGYGGNNYRLCVNINPNGISESSDWGLNCVIIWDQILTDQEMINLNDMINTYKSTGYFYTKNKNENKISSITYNNCNIIKASGGDDVNIYSPYMYFQINNNNGTLTNQQIMFTIKYNNKFRTDFQDLRFIDGDTNLQLNYYIENIVNSVSADAWVLVPTLSSNKNIYMTFNNSLSYGDPNKVFILYDDFSKIDSNTWQILSGTVNVTNNILNIYGNNNKTEYVTNDTVSIPLNFSVETEMYALGTGVIPEIALRYNNTNNYGISCRFDTRGVNNGTMGILLNNPNIYWSVIYASSTPVFPLNTIIKKTKISIIDNIIYVYYAPTLSDKYILLVSYNFGTTIAYNTAGKIALQNQNSPNGIFYVEKIKVYASTKYRIEIINLSNDYDSNNYNIGSGCGNDGGSNIYQLINTDSIITLKNNTIMRYNYGSNISINSGTYNVSFLDGSVNITSFASDYSYPLIYRNTGILNPSAWYKFDNTTNLGLDATGTYSMSNIGITSSSICAKGTNAAVFNNTATYIAGTGSSLDSKSFSISWWSYVTDLSKVSSSIYTRYETASSTRTTLHLMYRSSNIFRFGFYSDDVDAVISPSEHLNKWIFFTVTFNNSTLLRCIYINGKLVSSDFAGGVLLSTSGQVYNIGCTYARNSFFAGKIDDLRIYTNVVLSYNEIAELYKGRVEIKIQTNPTSAGIQNNENFSLITSGSAGTTIKGGDGGSALSAGRFTTTITGSSISVGLGGTGATATSTAKNGINYGDGGSGNGGLGASGIIIMRFPTTASTYLTIANNLIEMSNLQISGNIYTYNSSNNYALIDNYWTKSTINTNNIYYTQGNIGIGTLRPVFKLDIIDDINVVGNYYQNGSLLTYSGSGTVIFSDSRIKTNIIDINDNDALKQILKIEPKIYNYIDITERGTDTVYGFIAQQIREVIPQAVKIQKDFIPNIYKYYDCINYNQIITDEDLTTILKIGDRIKIKDNNQDFYRTATIITITETMITVDLTIYGDKCFIYGKEINDFHYLDKNYIYTLGVCATQDLYKILNGLNDKYNEQQMKIKRIKELLQQ